MEKEKLYAIYCARCGEEIKEGDSVLISEYGNSFDSLDCMNDEYEAKIENRGSCLVYDGPYNAKAVEFLNEHGKEESRIPK
jgi:hypothetical protein